MNCILFAYFLPKWYGLLVHFGQCHRKNMPVECHYLELSLIVVYKSQCRSISQYGKKKSFNEPLYVIDSKMLKSEREM